MIRHWCDDDFSHYTNSVKLVHCDELQERRGRMDGTTRTEIEAAVFRRLVAHLQKRPEVQNIDLMILAGFCRNCLGDWFRDAAEERGTSLTKVEAREIVYGMPVEEWKKRYQKEATAEQSAAFERAERANPHS